MIKRFITTVVVLTMLISVLTTGAAANTQNKFQGSFEVPAGTIESAYVGATVYNDSYYEQLNAEQTNAYNAMDPMPKTDTIISIDLITPLTFTSHTQNPTTAETAAVSLKVQEIMSPAINAYLRDNAIVFWLDLKGEENSTSYGMVYDGESYGGLYHWTINEIQLKVAILDMYEVQATSTYVTAVQNAVAGFSTASVTRYDILKDIHDFLCEEVVYVLNATHAHEPYGALVDGEAVCEGYAEAFKLLCDRYNISCAVIMGEGVTSSGSEAHMWNYVQMEDNLWYGVDVTWDDQSTIRYDYFLAGANTVVGTKSFSQGHIEDGTFLSGTGMEFTYPALNSTKYVPNISNEDAVLDPNSGFTLNGAYLFGVQDNIIVSGVIDGFSGTVVIADSNGTALINSDAVGTGCTVDIGSMTYTIIVLGDVDGSGTITSKDYLMVKRAFIGTLTLTDVQNKAACISGGESPTSVDYLKVKRHFIGTYNIFA